MPPIINVGGSVTGMVAVVLSVWGYKAATSALKKRAQAEAVHDRRSLGRYYAELSAAAVCALVAADPVPHLVLDVRAEEAVQAAPLTIAGDRVLNVPGECSTPSIRRRGGLRHFLCTSL
jgi:hypothetical protein